MENSSAKYLCVVFVFSASKFNKYKQTPVCIHQYQRLKGKTKQNTMRTKSKETKSGWNAFCDLVILSYCDEIQQLRHELRLEKVVKRSEFLFPMMGQLRRNRKIHDAHHYFIVPPFAF